jgi:hypothetical protein
VSGAASLHSEVIEVPGDPLALYERSLADKWGDGAPIIPPTDERVGAMLAATPYPPEHVIVALPPRRGAATVELAAINAAMAGCEPRAFPLVIAALEAMGKPAYNGFGLATTTGSVASYVIVNGPTRDELGIDCRAGCLGGAAGRGSVTVGRAVQLCLRNLGGMRAGDTSRTVFGQPARFGLCFGEWEERSDWPSLAERRGFSAGDEVVTVHGGMGILPVCDPNTEDDRELAYLIAKSVAVPMHNLFIVSNFPDGEVIICLNPIWAERFGATWPKIEDLQQVLYDNCWQPIDFWPSQMRKILHERKRVDSQGRVHAVQGPQKLVPFVAGGLGNLHCSILMSWGESEMQSALVKRK